MKNRGAWVLIGVFFLLAAGGILVVGRTGKPLFRGLDVSLFLVLNHLLYRPGVSRLMAFLSSTFALYSVLVLGMVLLTAKRRLGLAILLAFFFFSLYHLTYRAKVASRLPRPHQAESGFWHWTEREGWRYLEAPCGAGSPRSFPSGHALSSVFFLGFFWTEKRWRWVFLVPAVLIPLSRIALGVHYPSDIIFGGMIGFGIGRALWLLYYRSELLEGKR